MINLANGYEFVEQAPMIGHSEYSMWHEVANCTLPFPWMAELSANGVSDFQPVSAGWISIPGQALIPDEEHNRYREKFGWAMDDTTDPLAGRLIKTAEALINFARKHTFQNFASAVLGVSIESSFIFWHGPTYENPDDIDVLTHLDWTVREPCLLALGSSACPSILLEGPYTYKGDLVEENSVISYSFDDGELTAKQTEVGKVYIADSRRGLHGRPLMPKGFVPFPRNYLRAFVSQVNT